MLRNFLQHNTSFVLSEVRALTFSNMYFYRGKHQTQPKLRMRTVKPIYPPPGENLELPGISYSCLAESFRLDTRTVFTQDWWWLF